MPRNSKIATVNVDEAAGSVNFAFTNGTTVAVGIQDLPAGVQSYAALHGINQKLRDSYAGAESVTEALESFNKTLAALKSDKWSTRGEGDGQPVGQRAEAVRRYIESKTGQPCSIEQAQAKLASLADDKKKELYASPAIVSILADMAKERAATRDTDAASLLGI